MHRVLRYVAVVVALRLLRRSEPHSDRTPPSAAPADQQHPVDDTTWSVTASPAVEFALFVIGAVPAYIGLGIGVTEESPFDARAWEVWRATAAVAVGTSFVFLYRGIRALRALPQPVRDLSWRWKGFYLIYALCLAAGVFTFLLFGLDNKVSWPRDDMGTRTGVVAVLAGLAGVPWVALILIAQRPLRRVRSPKWEPLARIRRWLDNGKRDELTFHGRLQVWDLITACLGAFALFVALALIPTGALRALWLVYVDDQADIASEAAKDAATGTRAAKAAAGAAAAATKTEELNAEFSALDVLLYGAFFAFILAAITIPVFAVWRDTSRRLIDDAVPLPAAANIDDTVVAKRTRLETLLHLDAGLLRNPLTVFSILTPLITSLLAAFVPELKP